jgi:hypothetical protein
MMSPRSATWSRRRRPGVDQPTWRLTDATPGTSTWAPTLGSVPLPLPLPLLLPLPTVTPTLGAGEPVAPLKPSLPLLESPLPESPLPPPMLTPALTLGPEPPPSWTPALARWGPALTVTPEPPPDEPEDPEPTDT